MYKAKDIAQWFVNRACSDVGQNGGEYLTHLKLQKLLYYAQGCVLAITDAPLFDEKIEHWAYGPVVPAVFKIYKKYSDLVIDTTSEVNVDGLTESILNEVYDVFGQYSALKLKDMTHAEAPWQNTKPNEEITKDAIKEFFKKEYIVA